MAIPHNYCRAIAQSDFFVRLYKLSAGRLDACQAKFVQDDGKYASKRAAKAIAVNCEVCHIYSCDVAISQPLLSFLFTKNLIANSTASISAAEKPSTMNTLCTKPDSR